MKTKILICFVISIVLSITTNVFAANKGGGNTLVLNLVGPGVMYLQDVPDITGDGIDDEAWCFDVLLFNAENGHLVGTATDCLWNPTSEGDGLKLVGTTYFHLPQGMLVTRGLTTVQPVTQPTETTFVSPVTHITGAASAVDAIIDGDGRFAKSTGTVRLSGMVDMSNFNGEVGSVIAFDCLFLITLD
jgi:hypothetical protein